MILLACVAVLAAPHPPGTVLFRGAEVDPAEMIDSLSLADVVFVGENHEDSLAHRWEFFIWRSLAAPERALALEMFETDVQELLNAYLSGAVSREDFLEGSRPWGNYEEAYAPMVDYAAEHGFSVIAANVPRHYAAAVARGGWAALDRESFPGTVSVDSSNSGYRERFLATMDALGDRMHGMLLSPLNLYRAQLLKDAVMAASIAGRRCVFICGSFHSDFRSGIPDQLVPGTSFLTVKVLSEAEPFIEESADFVIIR
jgi:uncharacterized iron-regulated protein